MDTAPLQQDRAGTDGAALDAALADALRLVKLARFGEAAGQLDALEHEAPDDARIAFARGLIAQRTGDPAGAVALYRLAAARDPGLHAAAEHGGALLRGMVDPVRPHLTEPIAEHAPFIYVIGSSYARSFGTGARFLPLMAGLGDNLTFLTGELAARSREQILAHIVRCDPRNPVLLTLANVDAIGLVNETAGVQALQAEGRLADDAAVIEAAAHRQADLADEIRRRFPDLPLMVLCAFPMVKPAQAPLVRQTNAVLRWRCERSGLLFIDVHDRFADPASGLLRADLRSAPEDPHFGKHAVPLIEDAIAEHGLLPPGAGDFQWSHMMRFHIGPLDETRLWTEPHMGAGNLRQSRLNHFNHVLERALAHLFAALPMDGGESVLVANAREGLVPLALPRELSGRLTAAEADRERRLMLRRLAHFCGRDDIAVLAPQPGQALSAVADPHDHVFAVVHDDDAEPGDQAALIDRLQDWADLAMRRLYVLSTADWSGVDFGALMFSSGQLIDLSERQLAGGPWAGASLLVLER